MHLVASNCTSPRHDLSETIQRSKLVEAQQRKLIKQRLLSSPPSDFDEDDDFDSDDKDEDNINNHSSQEQCPLVNNQQKATINRARVPPPLKMKASSRSYVPTSIKTAPIRSNLNYRRSMVMAHMVPFRYVPVRNLQRAQQLLAQNSPQLSNLTPRTAYLSSSQLQIPFVYNKQRQPQAPGNRATTALRKKVSSFPTAKITKTTLTSKPSFPRSALSANHTAIRTPISATSGKKVVTPIVADIFSNGTRGHKLAPYESQPISARGEYFAFSDSDIEDDPSEEEESREKDKELASYEVENYAIEEDAVENTAYENTTAVTNKKEHQPLHAELLLGGKVFKFDMEQTAGHSMNSKVVFLNNCATVWNKFTETGTTKN